MELLDLLMGPELRLLLGLYRPTGGEGVGLAHAEGRLGFGLFLSGTGFTSNSMVSMRLQSVGLGGREGCSVFDYGVIDSGSI